MKYSFSSEWNKICDIFVSKAALLLLLLPRDFFTHPRTIRSIPQQTQHKKQQAQPLTTPIPLILDDLWYPRTEIAHGARVPQNLRAEGRLDMAARLWGRSGRRWWRPDACLPSDDPANGSDKTHANDAERVFDPLAHVLILNIGNGCKTRHRARPTTPARCTAFPPMTSRKTEITAIPSRQQRLLLIHLRIHKSTRVSVASLRSMPSRKMVSRRRRRHHSGRARQLPACFPGVEVVVVEALDDEDQVGEAEVDGKGDDGGDEAGP